MYNMLHKVIPEALQIIYMILVPFDRSDIFAGARKKRKLKREQHRKKKKHNAEISFANK